MSRRTVRRRTGRSAVDVGSSGRPGNGGGRPARAVALVLLAVALGGCSMSFPIGSLKDDELATGTIDRTAAALSPALDREDWRRARAALAVTLDPQGNGERAAWHNPQSGAMGSFTAVGPPFPDQDRVCRNFVGEIRAASAAGTHVSGSACRDGAGTWALRDDAEPRAS